MALTPVEVRHITFGRGLLGYKRGAVDGLLGDVADSFEDVWRERADLADKVEQLENDLLRYRELEVLLRTTLVSAERAAADMKEQARKDADLVLGEALAEARRITHQSSIAHERLRIETARMRERLRLALASVDEVMDEDAELEGAPVEDAPAGAEGPSRSSVEAA